MRVEFADRLKKIVDDYNRRRDEAYANEVLDDIAEQPLHFTGVEGEKNSFKIWGLIMRKRLFMTS